MSLTMPSGRYRYGPPSLPRSVAQLEATVARIATQSTTQQDLDKSIPATALTVTAGSYSLVTDLAGQDVVNQDITFLPAPIDTSVASNPNVAYPAYYLISYQVSGTSTWSAQVRVEDPGDGSQVVVNVPGLATDTTYIASVVTVTTAGVASPPVFVTFTTPGDTVPPSAPSTPTVTALIGALKCVWDGKTATGANMPSDFSFCEVHASTSAGFTPSSATLIGSILAASLGTILGGTKTIPDPTFAAMYVKLIAVDYSGNRSAASAQVGPVTAAKVDGTTDVVALSITAPAIANQTVTTTQIAPLTIVAGNIANQTVTTTQIAPQTIVAGNIANSTVTTTQIAGNTIVAGNIAAGTITTTEIAGRTITAGDIALAAITTTEIAGTTITAGNIANLTITGGQLAAGAVTAGKIAANAIVAGDIAANTITAGQIASGTITTTEIAANTIVAGDIASGTITTTEIAANTITAGDIAAGTITTTEIATNTITAGDIAAGTITTTEIAANTITAADIHAATITTNEIASATITGTNIAATTITGANIAANTITAGKMVALTITGAEIAANTITGGKMVANTIGAAQITAGSITTTEIAANTITAGDIAAGTITTVEIAANTIESGDIKANTITAGQIAAGTITTTEIAANTIVAGDIAALTITGACIAANTVTADKVGTGTLDVNQTITVGTPSGTRIEIGKDPLTTSNPGIRLYRDQITAPTVNFDAVTGAASFIGGIATGLDVDPRTTVEPAYFGNMVTNPTFDTVITSWTEYDAYPDNVLGAMTPSRDTGTKRSGAASLKLTQPAASPSVNGADCFVYQMVTCAASTTYTISVMVNCVVRTTGALSNRCLSVKGNVSGTFATTTITATTGAGVWRQHKINFTSGASDTALEIRLYGVAGTGAYINYDNVFMGPTDAFYSTMPVSPMVEFVPATADQINGGLYTGEIYNGDTDAATDQTSLLLRSPGWTATPTTSQASVFLASETRTASSSRMVTIDPALTVYRIKRGTGSLHGTNYTTRYRSTGFSHTTSGSYMDQGYNAAEVIIQDDGTYGTIYSDPNFVAPVTGLYSFYAGYVSPASGSIAGMQLYCAGKITARLNNSPGAFICLSCLVYLQAGDTCKVMIYQNSGGTLTIAQDNSNLNRATFCLVSG